MRKSTIKEILAQKALNGGPNVYLSDYILGKISPYCTWLFIRNGVRPNTVTCFMILFGIIGAILYMNQSLIFQSLAIVFIYLWYYMDIVDGEVARITKTFSKYGKELDYTAHVINHPLFILSLVLNCYRYSIMFALIIMLIGLVDSVYRALNSFNIIYSLKEINTQKEIVNNKIFRKPSLHKCLFLNLAHFPTFVMLFPLLLIWNSHWAFIYAVLTLCTSFTLTLLGILSWLKKIV